MTEIWENEPDKEDFIHEGLHCTICRTSHNLNVNGYVAVPRGHPAFGVSYELVDVSVHGGLTYAEHYLGSKKDDDLWWFGFDTALTGDLVPGLEQYMVKLMGGFNGVAAVYRDFEYVKAQTKSLAEQLNKITLVPNERR